MSVPMVAKDVARYRREGFRAGAAGGGRSLVAFALVAAALGCMSTACAKARTPSSAVSGTNPLVAARPYRLTTPATVDPDRSYPLVLVLHGLGGSGEAIEQYYQLDPLARELGFFVAYPEGSEQTVARRFWTRRLRFWNATDGCCDFYGSGVDDVAYLDAVIDDVSAHHRVDPKRIFVVGLSNGGYMAYRYACDRAPRVAAIVSQAGAMWRDARRCRPSEPVAVLEIHGTADERVPYEGKAPGASVGPDPVGPSVGRCLGHLRRLRLGVRRHGGAARSRRRRRGGRDPERRDHGREMDRLSRCRALEHARRPAPSSSQPAAVGPGGLRVARRPSEAVTDSSRTSLVELALLFLRLGTTAFGGPAAHIALMQEEVVRRRGWLSNPEFLDLLGATNLIPGPNSTEMAIHIGWRRRRWAGLVVAGVCFIVPAMLMTGALGWAYVRFGTRPEAGWLSWGVKPVILAVVAQAIWNLAKVATRTWPSRILAVAAMVVSALGVHELAILFGAGVALAAARRARGPGRGRAPERTDGRGELRQLVPTLPVATVAVLSTVTLPGLFWVFLKIGSVLFGSGYVLLAFLRADLVQRLHWLSEAQLIDAVAAGQVTPGPVFTTATFIGYVLAGPAGALVATAGIFLPAFVFVAVSGPLIPRLRGSPTAGAFLDGVNVASLALMALVAAQLARAAVVDVPTALLAAVAAGALLRFRVNPTWLVLGGAVMGLVSRSLGWFP